MSFELFTHAISPPARACEVLINLVDVTSKITNLDIFNGEQNKPEFLAINPAHCVPTLKDDNLVLWESRAIMSYICNKYGGQKFYPDVPEDRATVDFLLNWDLGSLYQSIITAFFPILGFKAAVSEETLAAEKQQFNSKLQFLNDHLVKGDFLAGQSMTIADISIASSLTMPTLLNITYDEYPKIQDWLKRVHALPEWQSVDKKFAELRVEIQKKLKSEGKL